MHGRRLVSLAVVALVAATVAHGATIEFVEPESHAVLLGPTTFTVALDADDASVDRIDLYVGGRLLAEIPTVSLTVSVDVPQGLSGGKIRAVAYDGDRIVAMAERPTLPTGTIANYTVRLVPLYPVVTGRGGQYVRDLGRDDFTVIDQGNPVEIERFSTEAGDLSIALVLDSSKSMEGKIGFVRDASLRFLEKLETGDNVAVYAFNHTLTTLVPMVAVETGGTARDGIHGLAAGGGTALYDSALRVLDDMKPLPGRKVVFLFSDGQDERSIVSLSTVVQAAHESQVIFYTVATVEEDNPDSRGRGDLIQLAEDTGGEAFFIRRSESLEDVYNDLLEELRAQYALAYTPPEGRAGIRAVEVKVKRGGTKVRCRTSYYYDGD